MKFSRIAERNTRHSSYPYVVRRLERVIFDWVFFPVITLYLM